MVTVPRKQLFSTKEAADILGVNVSRIRQLSRAGDLDAIKLSDRAWVYTRDAILSALDRRKRNRR